MDTLRPRVVLTAEYLRTPQSISWMDSVAHGISERALD